MSPPSSPTSGEAPESPAGGMARCAELARAVDALTAERDAALAALVGARAAADALAARHTEPASNGSAPVTPRAAAAASPRTAAGAPADDLVTPPPYARCGEAPPRAPTPQASSPGAQASPPSLAAAAEDEELRRARTERDQLAEELRGASR